MLTADPVRPLTHANAPGKVSKASSIGWAFLWNSLACCAQHEQGHLEANSVIRRYVERKPDGTIPSRGQFSQVASTGVSMTCSGFLEVVNKRMHP